MAEEVRTIVEEFGEKSKDADELDPSTLQEIKWINRGDHMDALYKALTKSGDPRYMHRYYGGVPTKENREWVGNILRMKLEQDPAFADTLSYEEGVKRVAPRKHMWQEGVFQLKKLLETLGQ